MSVEIDSKKFIYSPRTSLTIEQDNENKAYMMLTTNFDPFTLKYPFTQQIKGIRYGQPR